MATCPTCQTRYEDTVAQCPADGETLLPDQAFAMQDVELRAGEVVGEYQIEGKLGEGGFGTVYRAVHPLIGKRCAIKTLHRQFSSNPQMVSRFIAEARAVNQIRHRNIIDIFSFGALPDGRQYYLMELLDGMPFDRYLAREGPLPVERALPILRPIARALEAAHATGIAHRDLKPENIFLTFDDEGVAIPKLLDFGIAKLLTDGASAHKTRTGAPMGTPHYMSPEQCRGANVDHRTDIYAYGVLCHVVLTGRVPFDGPSVMDVLVMHMNNPPPLMSQHAPGVPAQLDRAVQHMLAKSADDRPQSVAAAFEELNDAARAAGFSVRPQAILSPSGHRIPASSAISAQLRGPAETGGEPLGAAKTVSAGDAPSRTFTPASSDIRPPMTSRVALYVGAGLAVLAAAGAAVWMLPRAQSPPDATAPPASQGTTPTVAATASAIPRATAAPAVTAAASTTVAPISPEASAALTAAATPSAAPSATALKRPGTGARPPHPAASVSKDLEQPF
jgi:serine/threonine-protein kinase